MPYPHVRVLAPSDAVALVVPSLPKGDLPLVCEYNGDLRKIGSIDMSAIPISQLLRVSELLYAKSADEQFRLKTSKDIMEAMLK